MFCYQLSLCCFRSVFSSYTKKIYYLDICVFFHLVNLLYDPPLLVLVSGCAYNNINLMMSLGESVLKVINPPDLRHHSNARCFPLFTEDKASV